MLANAGFTGFTGNTGYIGGTGATGVTGYTGGTGASQILYLLWAGFLKLVWVVDDLCMCGCRLQWVHWSHRFHWKYWRYRIYGSHWSNRCDILPSAKQEGKQKTTATCVYCANQGDSYNFACKTRMTKVPFHVQALLASLVALASLEIPATLEPRASQETQVHDITICTKALPDILHQLAC